MKLIILILCFTAAQASALVYGQKINLIVENVTFEEALIKISKQSKYDLVYDSKVLINTKPTSVYLKDTSLENALKELFQDQSLKYILSKNTIVVVQAKPITNLAEKPFEQAIQQKEISGRVTDQDGQALIGVSVKVKEGIQATSTNENGIYFLHANEGETIVFTYVGYYDKVVLINDQSIINAELEEDNQQLGEVVIVGYGVQKKASLTGAVATVNSEQLNEIAVGDATSRLQGRVSGVTVTSSNVPGGTATVRVRGYGSLGNNNPLFIIDGIPRNSMDNINPNDIESMTVLKDASSSAIYGSRAANGVIVVTTRSGKEGPPKLSFDVRFGVQNKTNSPDLMNSEEVGLNLWQKFKNMGLKAGDPGWGDVQYGYGAVPVISDYIFPTGKMLGEVDESTYNWPNPYNAITKSNRGETDWYNAVFSPAPLEDYNLSISGGNAGSTYSVSAGYLNQKSIINYKGDEINRPTHNGFKRYSLRTNADIKINNWLKIGPRLSATYLDKAGILDSSPAAGTLTLHPILPIYDINGNFAGSKVPGTGNATNQIARLIRSKDNYDRGMIVQGSTYAQADISKNLFLRTLIGVSYNVGNSMIRNIVDPEFNQTQLVSRLNVGSSTGLQYNWVNTLNYLKSINESHNINVLLGSEVLDNRNENLSGGRSTFAFTDIDYMVLSAGEKDITNGGTFDQSRLFSYFARLNYDYKGKYLLEGVVRRDASSRFVGKYRWGTFPAFSAGWRITEENFMSDISWLNDLKLRVGWGTNGNDNVGNYNAYSTYVANGNESYYNISGSSRSSSVAGFHQASVGNTQGRWETNVAKNVGLDISLFKSKLDISIDLYDRITTDMLYNDSRPGTWGQVTLPDINIGEMKNTGVDFNLTYRSQTSNDFSYSINTNFSYFKNKVIKLNNNPLERRFGNPVEASFNTVTQAGKPLNSFYGYIVEGIFNTSEEVAAWPKFNPNIEGVDVYSMPGVFKFKDVNGDGKITPLDRTFLGDGYPALSYGFNIDLRYKNWDMTAFFQGVTGRSIINNAKRTLLFIRNDGNFLKSRLYESWTPERYERGEKITLPITINNDANMQLPSSFFVENGDYLRMKNVQLGYTIPQDFMSKIKMQSLRVYLQASNLFTITKYSGMDVEVNETGIDGSVYPTPRILVFGLNMQF